MATDLAIIPESKCPLCGKMLTNEEYINVKNELKNQVSEEHKKEIQQHREKLHREEIKLLQKDLQGWYSKEIEDLKKSHEEDITKMKEYLKSEQERCMNIYRQEASSKENQLNELRKQIQNSKIEAKAKAETSARAEIDELRREVSERDIQLRRFGNEIEELKKQVIKTQPELKGEAGEANLLAILRNEFRQDLFTPQTRGISGGDIIQQIRAPTGELLKITIGYDNKEANEVNKSDIEKTKRDRNDQGIGYMIIVSRSFPKKEVKNGFLGNSDGVLLVHPNILIEYVRTIRTMIVRMSKISESMQDQEDKQEELYKYVTSEKFCRSFEKILEVHTKLSDLQTKEEKNHKSLWSNRKQLDDDLIDAYYNVSSEIERITQRPQPDDAPITNLQIADKISGNGKGHHPDYS